jgi:ferredoxin-nitrite reductase
MSGDFSPDQKRYLEGFMSGLTAARAARGVLPGAASGGTGGEPAGPDAIHIKAQDRTTAAGGKLADQEKVKREEHPFDAYARLKDQADRNEPPKPADNFRWRYFGLFYVAPAQSSYMCRLRIPNGILKHWQLAGLADLAERCAAPYAHVTTRANLQIREIEPKNAVEVVEGIESLGLWSRGSGADNIRNVTGTPTAGIDPQELIDTRPYAREWHFHILNDRSLYGLPRKFNVAFDGAGIIPVLEDTNDIGFQAVAVAQGSEIEQGHGIEPGIWFRLALGGITGHRDFARDTGIIVKPKDATKVADAIVRVFIEHGDRTNRNKARLKYVLDAWGFDTFLAAVEEKLGTTFTRAPAEAVLPRPAFDRSAHIGVRAQKQKGLNWIGIVFPVGKITVAQMRGLAKIAQDLGDGDIRLTVWQNLLISGVPDDKVALAEAAIAALGLATTATAIRAGLVACTGATGCRFAAAHTKEQADEIAAWCEARVAIDTPVNIHLTGCHHSCAQHYIGDVGLIAARVPINDDGDTVDGYHVHVGGGFGPGAAIAREIYRDVKAEDAPRTVERMLKGYLAHRAAPDESFLAFTRRHEVDALKTMFDAEAGE